MSSEDRRRRLARMLALEGSTTADALASRLGVSRRSVLRDIEALRRAGVRIDAQRGVGGGFRMGSGALPIPVQLDESEIVALWISAELAIRAGVFPFVDAARGAARKAIASLTAVRRNEVRRFLARIFVGPPASSPVVGTLRPVPQRILVALERAFTERTCLRLTYVDRHARASERDIEIHGVLIQAPIWYALGFDHLRSAPRMFRVDRIDAARIRPQRATADASTVFEALIAPYWDPRALAVSGRR
jgi:predicted DNA-binding transcriptional regulator YafY